MSLTLKGNWNPRNRNSLFSHIPEYSIRMEPLFSYTKVAIFYGGPEGYFFAIKLWHWRHQWRVHAPHVTRRWLSSTATSPVVIAADNHLSPLTRWSRQLPWVITYCCDPPVSPRSRLSSTATSPVVVADDDHLSPLTHWSCWRSPRVITCRCNPVGSRCWFHTAVHTVLLLVGECSAFLASGSDPTLW